MAVSCSEAISHSERVAKASRPAHAYILVWNFKDPIHPEYVLQVGVVIEGYGYREAARAAQMGHRDALYRRHADHVIGPYR